MRARWVLDLKSSHDDDVPRTLIASYWPGRYYVVETLFIDTASSNRPLSVLIRKIDPESAKDVYVTQVFNCDASGWPRSNEYVLHYAEYPDRERAIRGHRETVELLRKGRLPLKKRLRFRVDGTYKWTRWAAPGGKGYGMIEWIAVFAGLGAAIWAFRSISSLWLALPGALIAWFLSTNLVGALWALIRRLVEGAEGIR